MIREFIKQVDALWETTQATPLPLKVIGGAALVLNFNYSRVTKDTDIIEVSELTNDIQASLAKIAGSNSTLCRRFHLYIDVVKKGIPMLPPKPNFLPDKILNSQLKNFHVEVLDVTDVIVSKIRRFSATDIDDIKAMIDLKVVSSDELLDRFKQAIEPWKFDARSEELPQIIKNFHSVQRDMLFVEESSFVLPDWISQS